MGAVKSKGSASGRSSGGGGGRGKESVSAQIGDSGQGKTSDETNVLRTEMFPAGSCETSLSSSVRE